MELSHLDIESYVASDRFGRSGKQSQFRNEFEVGGVKCQAKMASTVRPLSCVARARQRPLLEEVGWGRPTLDRVEGGLYEEEGSVRNKANSGGSKTDINPFSYKELCHIRPLRRAGETKPIPAHPV